MPADYRNRGGWNDDDDDGRLSRPSGGVGSSSIAYESGRRRSGRRRMITLAIVLVVVGGFGAIVWNAYNQGQQSNGDGVVPLIQADNAPTKVRPEQPGGMDVPNQDKLIYDRLSPGQSAPTNVERLLPPPETPMARPEPPPPPQQTESLLPEAAPAPAPRAPVQQTPDIQPPSIARAPATPTPPPAAAAPPAQLAKPAAPPAAVASIPPASHSAANGSFRVQLGAVRSQDAAKKEWERLQSSNKDLLGKLNLSVSQANLGDRGTFYRVQAGPVGDQQAATDLCAKLKARNVSCIIVKQ